MQTRLALISSWHVHRSHRWIHRDENHLRLLWSCVIWIRRSWDVQRLEHHWHLATHSWIGTLTVHGVHRSSSATVSFLLLLCHQLLNHHLLLQDHLLRVHPTHHLRIVGRHWWLGASLLLHILLLSIACRHRRSGIGLLLGSCFLVTHRQVVHLVDNVRTLSVRLKVIFASVGCLSEQIILIIVILITTLLGTLFVRRLGVCDWLDALFRFIFRRDVLLVLALILLAIEWFAVALLLVPRLMMFSSF